jgi:DNA repair protein RadA
VSFCSGKTQIGHQLAVNTILPLDQGGFDGEVFYIDTEDTFRPERITQMAEAVGIDPQDALDRIHVARAYNSAHQMLLVDEIKRMSKNIDVKLIIVDSLTSHFRAEYIGRGMLAPRQQKLNRHMKELKQVADVQNALILVTNQVMSKPDAMWGDPTRAMRRPPFDFLRYKRNVLACATMCPPIALVGSPHIASGFDMT